MSEQHVGGQASEDIARRLVGISILVIAGLGVAALAVGFYLGPTRPLGAGVFFGVGTSLLAYVTTTALHTWVTEAASLHAMQSAINANVRSVLTKVQQETYSQIAREFPKFIPSTFFSATKGRSLEFERELVRAISESRHYYFRGVTGRHVPIWLDQSRPQNLQVTVLILSPKNKDLLTIYIMDRFGSNGKFTAAQLNQELAKVVDEIYYSIVGLFDRRHLCPITIKVHNGPVFFRSEFFDAKCFVSFYVDDPGTNYPTTYVYNRDSLFYATFHKDINNCMQIETEAVTLTSGTSDETLIEFLKKIGYVGDIEDLRRKFAAFAAEFKAATGQPEA